MAGERDGQVVVVTGASAGVGLAAAGIAGLAGYLTLDSARR